MHDNPTKTQANSSPSRSNAENLGTNGNSLPAAGEWQRNIIQVYQLYKDIETGDKKSKFNKNQNEKDPIKRIKPPINWVTPAERSYDLIYGARDQLDLDHKDYGKEKKKLDEFEAQVDKLVEEGNALIESFNKDGSKTGDLNQLRSDFIRLQAELDEEYSKSDTKINALGRATKIEGAKVEEDHSDQKEADGQNYLQNIELGGKNLSDHFNVVKPPFKPKLGEMPLYILGKKLNTTNIDKESFLKNFERLSEPEPSKVTVTKEFTGKSRGAGQETAMNSTNARGYAFLTGETNYNQTNWEWLHLRAASLGGETDPTNLVLGTRDSNTHMMPFEDNLRFMAKSAKEKGGTLKVDWSPESKDGYSHKYKEIKMAWKLNIPKSKEINGEAVFHPLDASSVLSKEEVIFFNNTLKEHREGKSIPEKKPDTSQIIPDTNTSLSEEETSFTLNSPGNSPVNETPDFGFSPIKKGIKPLPLNWNAEDFNEEEPSPLLDSPVNLSTTTLSEDEDAVEPGEVSFYDETNDDEPESIKDSLSEEQFTPSSDKESKTATPLKSPLSPSRESVKATFDSKYLELKGIVKKTYNNHEYEYENEPRLNEIIGTKIEYVAVLVHYEIISSLQAYKALHTKASTGTGKEMQPAKAKATVKKIVEKMVK